MSVKRRPCAFCGNPCYGEAHPACRPLQHGLESTYNKRGCRCDLCRAAATTRARNYREAYLAEHGTGYWTGRERQRPTYSRSCEQCLEPFTTRNAGARFCGVACAGRARRTPHGDALVDVGPPPPIPRQPRTHRWAPRPRLPRWWARIVQGPCAWCGKPFTAPTPTVALYCGDTCAGYACRARAGDFLVDPRRKLALCERDEWTCHLCRRPVTRTASASSPWAATLDHIVPRSRGGSDEDDNLRLAHRQCNSLRGVQPVVEARARLEVLAHA